MQKSLLVFIMNWSHQWVNSGGGGGWFPIFIFDLEDWSIRLCEVFPGELTFSVEIIFEVVDLEGM